jgi:hypothetical protein
LYKPRRCRPWITKLKRADHPIRVNTIMKANIKTNVDRLTPVKLLALLTNVQAKLEAATVLFPTPPVSPADLATLAKELEDAIELATDGSRSAKADRDVLVLQTRQTLTATADYVRMVCKGDAASLTKSGFPMAKQRQPIGVVGTPLLLEARMTGQPGEAELRWTGVYGRRAYHVYVTDQDPTLPGASWQLTGVTSKTRFLADSLEAYKAYWFCVSAIGALGEGVKSDPIIARAA